MANRYLVGSGAFTSTSIWSTAYGGSSGASVPVSGDIIYVDNNYNITSGLPSDSTFDFIVRLGANTASSVTLGLGGSPTFRLLDIRSANSAAHTVSFDSYIINVNKFIAIGSSASSRLRLTSSYVGEYNENTTLLFTDGGTCYGQFVNQDGVNTGNLQYSKDGVTHTAGYIGSNSIKTSGGGTGYYDFELQDPPKISTLVDSLTTAPGSNGNWTVTGTVTQVTTGHDGGGYSFASSGTNSITSTDTYDLVGSSVIIESDNVADVLQYTFGLWGRSAVDTVLTNSPPYPAFDFEEDNGFYSTLESLPSVNGFVKLSLTTGGTLTGQYSADGMSWTTAMTATVQPQYVNLYRSMRLPVSGNSATLGSINPTLTPNAAPDFLSRTPTLYQPTITTSLTITPDFIHRTPILYQPGTVQPPFPSGSEVTYTVQDADTLANDTYYWRVRAKDPSGSNAWGDWSEIRSLIISSTITISPDLISRSPTVHSPTTYTIADIAPALLSHSPTLYAPTVTPGAVTITPTFLSRTASLFSPTVTASYTINPSLISRTPTAYTPTITATITLSAPFIAGSHNIYAPTITANYTISPDKVSRTPVVYSASVSIGAPQTLTPNKVSRTPTVYAPTVTSSYEIKPSKISRSPVTYTPTITVGARNISPDFLSHSSTIHNPTVNSVLEISTPYISRVSEVFLPAISATTDLTPATAISKPEVFQPLIEWYYAVFPDKVTSAPTVYIPTATFAYEITVGFISRTPVVYTPTITTGATDIVVPFLGRTPVVYTPLVTRVVSTSRENILFMTEGYIGIQVASNVYLPLSHKPSVEMALVNKAGNNIYLQL